MHTLVCKVSLPIHHHANRQSAGLVHTKLFISTETWTSRLQDESSDGSDGSTVGTAGEEVGGSTSVDGSGLGGDGGVLDSDTSGGLHSWVSTLFCRLFRAGSFKYLDLAITDLGDGGTGGGLGLATFWKRLVHDFLKKQGRRTTYSAIWETGTGEALGAWGCCG